MRLATCLSRAPTSLTSLPPHRQPNMSNLCTCTSTRRHQLSQAFLLKRTSSCLSGPSSHQAPQPAVMIRSCGVGADECDDECYMPTGIYLTSFSSPEHTPTVRETSRHALPAQATVENTPTRKTLGRKKSSHFNIFERGATVDARKPIPAARPSRPLLPITPSTVVEGSNHYSMQSTVSATPSFVEPTSMRPECAGGGCCLSLAVLKSGLD